MKKRILQCLSLILCAAMLAIPAAAPETADEEAPARLGPAAYWGTVTWMDEDTFLLDSGKEDGLGDAVVVHVGDAPYLDAVTGNLDVDVTREIPQENLVQAQVYRLYVGKSTAGNDNNVRINELELYAYTGKLVADTNGVFVADEIGTWNVSYQKGGQELESIQVRVRLSDQDLVDLSQAVELCQERR